MSFSAFHTRYSNYYYDQRKSLDIKYRRNRKLKLFGPEIITPLQLFKETGDENER